MCLIKMTWVDDVWSKYSDLDPINMTVDSLYITLMFQHLSKRFTMHGTEYR